MGAALLDAVAIMDRLRSPGGCPWDAAQTHLSLRQNLIEEAYELLEAIEDGDRAALREELGDLLLQVLFHARLAVEHPADPFTVDDVAMTLTGKLTRRHSHVFGSDEIASHDVSAQLIWERRKQEEKQRESSVDGVPLRQPAVGLAAKLALRATRAGLPADLLPGWNMPCLSGLERAQAGAALFALAASAGLAEADPESELRAAARQFADDVRKTEQAARSAGVDPAGMDSATWREFWTVASPVSEAC
jgi:XTP/dITP diphosphohydrolase